MIYTNVQKVGNSILCRGYDSETGNRVKEKIDFLPKLYLRSQDPNTEWKTIYNEPLEEISCGSITDTLDFIKQYKDVPGFAVYGNLDFPVQYIGSIEPKDGHSYDLSKIRIANIDIETKYSRGFPSPDLAEEEVTVITVLFRFKNKYQRFVLAYGVADQEYIQRYCKNEASIDAKTTVLVFANERQMFLEFIELWKAMDPDIVTGWNIDFFDMPYLYNRISTLFDEKKANLLSPLKRTYTRKVTMMGQERDTVVLCGLCSLDYQRLYTKYTFNSLDSYKLDNVGNYELGEKKIDYYSLGFDTMADFYTKDFTGFVKYNIRDVDIVEMLDQKLGLIDLHLSLAYLAGVNYDDIFSQVRTWDALIYNYLRRKKVSIPQKRTSSKNEQYAGAYVKDPHIGMHKWVASFDLNSLYPSLIRGSNISPDTLLDKESLPDTILDISSKRDLVDDLLSHSLETEPLQDNNVCMTANREFFSKESQGFLPYLMESMYKGRVEAKKKMIEAKKELQRVKEEIERRNSET